MCFGYATCLAKGMGRDYDAGKDRFKVDKVYAFGSFVADPATGTLRQNGAHVVLTLKSFEVLMVLIERRGQIVDKDVLLKLVAYQAPPEDETDRQRHKRQLCHERPYLRRGEVRIQPDRTVTYSGELKRVP